MALISPHLSIYVNPARAGMIRRVISWAVSAAGKPRASGDDPLLVASEALIAW